MAVLLVPAEKINIKEILKECKNKKILWKKQNFQKRLQELLK